MNPYTDDWLAQYNARMAALRVPARHTFASPAGDRAGQHAQAAPQGVNAEASAGIMSGGDVCAPRRLSIRFTIPGPPAPKGRARAGRTRDGRPIHFTPAKTRSYEALVALAAQQAMDGAEPFAKGSALLLKVDATLPVPTSWSQKKRQAALDGALLPGSRPDIDNLVKAASDGCNGILWADDSQIAWLWASKRYGAVPGLTVECSVI